MPKVRRLLLTGAGGLLGSNIAAIAGDDYRITKIHSPRSTTVEGIRLDLSRPEVRDGLIAQYRPDLVINCAANPSVDSCEKREMTTYQINVKLPEDLAKQTLAFGAKFVHISSDAVYSGESGNYSELSPVAPVNAYGEMKLESESKVLGANPDSLVLRTNFFGLSADSDRGLADFFLSNLTQNNLVQGFEDSFVSFIHVDSLTKAMFELVDANVNGVFNLGSVNRTSKYEFGRLIAEVFDLDSSLVVSATSNQVQVIPRGKDLSLDISLAESLLETPLPTVYQGVRILRHNLESGRRVALQQVIRQ